MQATVSPDETAIYSQIKHIFDPANILMPDIKKEVPAKELADELNFCGVARSHRLKSLAHQPLVSYN